jgi:hypothetical protein
VKRFPIPLAILVLALNGHGAGNSIAELKSGFEAMQDIGQLPLLFPNGTQTRQPLSYDPTGGNWDHHFMAAFTKYVETTTQPDGSVADEYVIFDEYGPGCLYRQQMNAWLDRSAIPNGWVPLGELDQPRANANIRYYFDDEKQPRIDLHLKDMFNTKTRPFDEPLGFIDPARIFADLYYPFPFQKRLKIAMRPNAASFTNMDVKWYQFTSLAYPADFKVETWAGNEVDSPAVRSQWQKCGENPNDLSGCKRIVTDCAIKAGESRTIFKINKPGSLVGLRIKLTPYTKETFFDANMKIFWDGNDKPSVDLPLGYLFGSGGKDFVGTAEQVFEKSLTNLLFGFSRETGSVYTYWPMPFWKSARIVVENRSGHDIEPLACEVMFKPSSVRSYPRDNTGYFCAKRNTDGDPDGLGYRGVAFEETGRGHVVGKVFYTEKYDMDGDEFTYIDDSQTPQIHGSGTEDDHNQGWAGRACQLPLWGALVNGYNGAYRIYLNDCYVFNKHILTSYEYSLTKKERFPKGGNTDVTIFYYKAGTGPNLQLTDEMDVGNHFSETRHHYQIRQQTWQGSLHDQYDAYERNLDYGACTDEGRAFNGSSQFTVTVDPKNQGIKLRKRINRNGNGVQSAEVFVDGNKVGRPWHIVTPSSSTRKAAATDGSTTLQPANATGRDVNGWYDSDFEIPASFSKGKDRVTVEIRYVASAQKDEINEFYYWIYTYR